MIFAVSRARVMPIGVVQISLEILAPSVLGSGSARIRQPLTQEAGDMEMTPAFILSIVGVVVAALGIAVTGTAKWAEFFAMAKERFALRLNAYEAVWPAALAAGTSGSFPVANEDEADAAIADRNALGAVLQRHAYILPAPILNAVVKELDAFDIKGRITSPGIQPGAPMAAAAFEILEMMRRDLRVKGEITLIDRFLTGSLRLALKRK